MGTKGNFATSVYLAGYDSACQLLLYDQNKFTLTTREALSTILSVGCLKMMFAVLMHISRMEGF